MSHFVMSWILHSCRNFKLSAYAEIMLVTTTISYHPIEILQQDSQTCGLQALCVL